MSAAKEPTINTSDHDLTTIRWAWRRSKADNLPQLFLEVNGIAVAQVHITGDVDNITWTGFTQTRTTRPYKKLLKCVQAVERMFDIAIN